MHSGLWLLAPGALRPVDGHLIDAPATVGDVTPNQFWPSTSKVTSAVGAKRTNLEVVGPVGIEPTTRRLRGQPEAMPASVSECHGVRDDFRDLPRRCQTVPASVTGLMSKLLSGSHS